MNRRTLAPVVAVVLLVGLASPLVAPATATGDTVTIHDSAGGTTTISTATDGETVYVKATDGSTRNTTKTVTVTNASGGSIQITLADDGTGDDTAQNDTVFWGSFTVSATTTDDAADTLMVQKGNAASVSVDLDGQSDGDSASVTADYGPVPQSATTHDNDTDGTVDNVTVTFDEAVTSGSPATSDFSVAGGSVTGIADDDGDAQLVLRVGSLSSGTAITPDVTVAQDAVTDGNGYAGPASGSVTVTANDGAAPAVTAAETADTNHDGTVDQLQVSLSEPLDDGASSLGSGTFSSLTGATVGSASTGASSGDAAIVVGVSGAPSGDTSVTFSDLVVSSGALSDGTNANGGQTVSTVADGAAPTFASVTTHDAVANGQLDNLTVTFSEPVASGTVEAADFAIGTGNGYYGVVSGVAGDDGDDTVKVHLLEMSTPDTGATPTLAYVQSGGGSSAIQDAAGNLMADTTSDPATDGAAPYATSVTALDSPPGGTADGSVDSLKIEYSEDVSGSSPEGGDYSLGGTDAGSVSVDGASPSLASRTVAVAVTAPANDTALDLTMSYDATAGTADSVHDAAGNAAASFTGRTVADGAGPRMQSVVTNESTVDGTVDRLNVTFTEPVDDGSLDAAEFSGVSVSAVNNPGGTDDNRTALDVTGLTAGDTSVTPSLSLAADSVTDLSSGSGTANTAQTLTATDGAGPAITAAKTVDSDGDGAADRVDVTLSEAVDDGASTLDATAFSLSAGTVDGVTTGTADDATVRVSVSGISGSATPDVTLKANKLRDAKGNAISVDQTFTGTTSGVAPVVTAATTLDRDDDGNVDAANVTFSAPISDGSLSAGDWTVGGQTVDTIASGTANDDEIQLRLADGNEASGTDAKQVTYTPGSTTGVSGNPVPAVTAGDVAETDGAAPHVSSFTASQSGERVRGTVTSSEPIDSLTVDLSGPETDTLTSFTSSGSGPYTQVVTYAPDVDGTYTLTLRKATDAAGNDGASGQTADADVTFAGGSSGAGAPSPYGASSLRVGSAQTPVFSDTSGTTLDLSGGPVTRVRIDTTGSGQGFVRATSLSGLPSGTAAPDRPVAGVVDLQVPGTWQEADSTVRISLRASSVSVDPGRLRVAHHGATGWTTLETSVVAQTDSTVVLEAETPGFSLFAVTVAEPTETDAGTPTPTQTATSTGSNPPTATTTPETTEVPPPATTAADDEATPTRADTETASDGAGFGALAALVGLLLGLAALRFD